MDNYKSVLHFTLTVSLCLIGLIFSSKDATAAIVANDGGITLWVSWDDLDNPGKDIGRSHE